MFSITQATIADVEDIRRIAEQTWWVTYLPILQQEQIRYMLDVIYSEAVIKEQIEGGSQLFLLLTEADDPVAFAAYSPYEADPGAFKLHKLYCLPQTQGKGYGRILTDEVCRIAKEAGAKKLLLNVNRNNNALSFYQKMGFGIAREEDIAIGPYWMNDYVMEKILIP